MTRQQFLRSISSAEYAELLAFSRLEAVGLERSDLHFATVASAMAGGVKPEDFQYTPVQTAEEFFELMGRVAVHGSDS